MKRSGMRQAFSFVLLIGTFLPFFFFLNLSSLFPSDIPNIDQCFQLFEKTFPFDRYDLFWTIVVNNSSIFIDRYTLVIQSILIHHPNATVYLFTLTSTEIFNLSSYRRRGYRIYSIDLFSIDVSTCNRWSILWNKPIDPILLKWSLLYSYGGTYFDLNTVLLQVLPREEFIENYPEIFSSNLIRLKPYRSFIKEYSRQLLLNQCSENCNTKKNFIGLIDVKIVEYHRCLSYNRTNSSFLYHQVERDRKLQFFDLIKRCPFLYLYNEDNIHQRIQKNSLIDLILLRYNLREDPSKPWRSFIHRSTLISRDRRRNRFWNENLIYFRLNETMIDQGKQWNLTLKVSNGTLIFDRKRSFFRLNQYEINEIFHQMIYQPNNSTTIDHLIIELDNGEVQLQTSMTILIFSRWITFITKTMGSKKHWTRLKRLVRSVHQYYPETAIRIGSDASEPIDPSLFYQFVSSNGTDLTLDRNHLFLHNLPDDSGLSYSRNYLVNQTTTPFFFLLDDDFVLEDDSHIDLLLEMFYENPSIDIIAGKIPEDIISYQDFSGIFLSYNRTLELTRKNRSIEGKLRLFQDQVTIKDEDSLISSCDQVDFVPNVFLGRKKSVEEVLWNKKYKVGEHEDFFLRFRQSNRTVFTCRYIHVHHYQYFWWKNRTDPYYLKRTRVYHFFRQMLFHHGFQKLIAFNYVHVDFTKNPFNKTELVDL